MSVEHGDTREQSATGRSRRVTAVRGEMVVRRPLVARAARRTRYVAAVARQPRLAGPAMALGRRTSIVFGDSGRFSRGRNLTLADGFSAVIDGDLRVGDDVFFNRDANLSVYSSLSVGDRCRFGERLSVHDEDHNIASSGSRQASSTEADAYLVSDVTIEDDVWVGANVTILRGSHIGAGAVIAAGAVVRGTVPSRTIAGGVPARVLKRLG